MNRNNDYVCKQLEYLLLKVHAKDRPYNIYFNEKQHNPPHITVHLSKNRMSYDTIVCTGLVYFRILLLKEVLQ